MELKDENLSKAPSHKYTISTIKHIQDFEQTEPLFSETLLGLEGERTIPRSLHWNLGLVSRDTCHSSDRAQHNDRFENRMMWTHKHKTKRQNFPLQDSIPVSSSQFPIQQRLQVGLGLQTSYTIQRSQSDFTTYFNTSWYTSPIPSSKVADHSIKPGLSPSSCRKITRR